MAENIAPSDVTSRNDVQGQYEPGELIRTKDDRTYKYVRLVDAFVTPVAGQVVYRSELDTNYDGWQVTNDLDMALTQTGVDAMGVLTNAVTEGNWTFIQTWGYFPTVATDGTHDIMTGDALVGTIDGACCAVNGDDFPGGLKLIGYAQADDVDATDTVAAFLILER